MKTVFVSIILISFATAAHAGLRDRLCGIKRCQEWPNIQRMRSGRHRPR
jgi:hypothetical protein